MIKSRLENVFLILCLFWGLLFFAVNPPFQGSDEASHFYKVYGYVEGSFNFKKLTVDYNGEKLTFQGQILPDGIVKTANANSRITYLPDEKTNLSEIKDMFKIPLNKEMKVFAGYPVPFYTPFSYLFMIPCVWILSLFNTAPLVMMYVCRACSLLTYAVLGYFAIQITPVKKLLFFACGLLPMAVYGASSLSADGITNGLALLLCAYIFNLAFNEKVSKVSNKQTAFFFALCFFLILCKFTYFPLVLAFLLIDKKKFGTQKAKLTAFSLVLLFCLVEVLAITGLNLTLSQDLTSFATRIDKADLLSKAVSDPLWYLSLVIKTLAVNGKTYLAETIGSFGWGTVVMPFYTAIIGWLALILSGAVNLKEPGTAVKTKDKALIAVICTAVIFLIMSVCYLLFTYETGQKLIDNFQGRYLIPILPLIMLIFNNKFLNFKTNVFKFFILFCTNFILVISLIKLIERFY